MMNLNKPPIAAILLGLLLTLLVPSPTLSSERPTPPAWALLTGYGASHPGWGDTEQRVETLDLILRYERPLVPVSGSSWRRGYHSLRIELPVHVLLDPRSEPPMLGLTFLGQYRFTADPMIQPYLLAGGGPVYIPAHIEGVGAKLNGNYQAGAGLDITLSSSYSLLFEIRYHHISNGGTTDPNMPLNSTKFLFGARF
ncbi:MAG: acyloxyacyl hydrolase [Candidatus Competibacteraceae bacterium]|nr:acyloxyacyl hydrolase [Candidatus Competibacteraceae bacterium]HRY14592.1 acyloxyacyl hydrolase [Candidatus Competibacteraceae bacterium]